MTANIVLDLHRFAETWLSNPVAYLEFAKLIRRAMDAEGAEAVAVIQWVEDERATARRLGIR